MLCLLAIPKFLFAYPGRDIQVPTGVDVYGSASPLLLFKLHWWTSDALRALPMMFWNLCGDETPECQNEGEFANFSLRFCLVTFLIWSLRLLLSRVMCTVDKICVALCS